MPAHIHVKEGANIMKSKMSLCIVLTMVALLGCLGMAEAQDTQSTGSGALTNGGVTPFAVSPGWYFLHPAYCTVYTDGVTSFLYIYPVEGGYLVTTNLAFHITLAPACQTGNIIAVYFFDTSGHWNQLNTHPYK
jgi:hypothetical protein